MPRLPRISLEGLVYHIIQRGNNRQNVFREPEDFESYLHVLKRFKKKYSFKLYCYCLMSNHVHFIIEPTQAKTLSKIIQSITLSHIRLYHSKYSSSGHLWQGRFKNPIIQADNYLLQCLKYIELNPVRAGIVKTPQEYKWSSYAFHAAGKDDMRILDKDVVYSSLAQTDEERYKAYQRFLAFEQEEEIVECIRTSMASGILGSEQFSDSVRGSLALSKTRSRGRPRKH